MGRTAATLLHDPRTAARLRWAAAATLGVLWLGAWPASLARAEATRNACVATHVQGQELKLAGDYAAARAQFVACSARACPAVIRDDCAALLAGLDAELPTVVLSVRTTDGRPVRDARVFVDGTLVSEATDGRALALPAGGHQLRVEAPGRQPSLSQLEVAAGDHDRTVEVALATAVVAAPGASEPLPAPVAAHPERRRSLWPVYALGSASVAAFATAAALGGVGKGELDRLRRECKTRVCSDEEDDKGRSLYVAADVAIGVGSALGVAALTVYFVRYFRHRDTAHALAPLDAQAGASGAMLRYRASF